MLFGVFIFDELRKYLCENPLMRIRRKDHLGSHSSPNRIENQIMFISLNANESEKHMNGTNCRITLVLSKTICPSSQGEYSKFLFLSPALSK
jgi:hypothetical protein